MPRLLYATTTRSLNKWISGNPSGSSTCEATSSASMVPTTATATATATLSSAMLTQSGPASRKKVHFSLDSNTTTTTYSSSEYDRKCIDVIPLSNTDIQEFLKFRVNMRQQLSYLHSSMIKMTMYANRTANRRHYQQQPQQHHQHFPLQQQQQKSQLNVPHHQRNRHSTASYSNIHFQYPSSQHYYSMYYSSF